MVRRTPTTAGSVRSADGTSIVYERAGDGSAVIMIDPALGYSGFDSIRGLGALLADAFTVITYDRRGRGDSGDTPPYAVQREIEDLDALITEAGGSASVYGFSSGGLLALHAAAAGLPIRKLALMEPPVRDAGEPPDEAFTAHVSRLVSEGRRAEAVDFFLTTIGVPEEALEGMIPARAAVDRVAHTLVYDCAISDATSFATLRSVTTPTLVLDSLGSSDDLTGGAAAVAGALPRGTRRSLAGEWHGVPSETLAPVLADFFGP